MAYRFETDSNFFRVTDTSTSEILINEVRSGLKWGYTVDLTYAIYFKEAITNSTEDEIFKVSDYSFAFADIVDADDLAFTTEAIFRQWLSQRLGFIGDEAIITQFIRDGHTETVPSEDAVYDALELKLDITALPSNLTLYPTSTVSDIATYYKMVTSVTDPDYDSPAVDFATTGQLGVNVKIGAVFAAIITYLKFVNKNNFDPTVASATALLSIKFVLPFVGVVSITFSPTTVPLTVSTRPLVPSTTSVTPI